MWFSPVLLFLACRGEPTPPPTTAPASPTPVELTPEPTPRPPPPPVTADPMTVRGHAQECAQALGPIPAFDCLDDAQPVPVTADGQPITASGASACDHPSLLESSCNPFTRAGRKMGTHHDGSPRPEVSFVFTCRSHHDAPPNADGNVYHDVAMIGHNELTGATCYFQSFPNRRIRAFPSPLTAGTGAPDLGDEDAASIWYAPAQTAGINCHRCHHADPWIHSPWIDQLADPADPDQPLVPLTPNNATPYHVVGIAFEGWTLRAFDLPDNACTSCHRIGTGGCNRFVEYSAGHPTTMPLTATTEGVPWMPPGFTGDRAAWDAVWAQDVDELVACCEAGTSGPGACPTVPIPEGDRYLPPTPPPVVDTGLPDTGTACAPPDADAGDALGPLWQGSTCGAGDDVTPSCGQSTARGEEVAVAWTAPSSGTFRFDTFGSSYDTTLSARTGCASGDTELGCNDDAPSGGLQSQLELTLDAGDEVVLVIDAYGSGMCGDALLQVEAL